VRRTLFLKEKYSNFFLSTDFGANENTFVIPFNSTVEISFIGGAGHAFHLQYVSQTSELLFTYPPSSGHAFDVIQSASGGPANFVNPPRRDVVASGGTTTQPVRIRFRTDNPGSLSIASFS